MDRNVFFIVTTRPKKEVRFQLRVGHVKDFDFGDEVLSENNKEDAECFIRSWLQNDSVQEWMKANECGEEQFVCELLVKSQGNFMYLHHVLPSIADPNSHLRPRQPFRIQDLPQGLLAFYHQHWEQMQREDLALFERLYEPVVCVLAAVEELVTVDILSEVTGLGEREVRRVLQEWWEFLYRTTEPNGLELYRLYHRSFQEFLEKEVDGLRKYHDMIGDFALKELGME